jgi:hypothetical protein
MMILWKNVADSIIEPIIINLSDSDASTDSEDSDTDNEEEPEWDQVVCMWHTG